MRSVCQQKKNVNEAQTREGSEGHPSTEEVRAEPVPAAPQAWSPSESPEVSVPEDVGRKV